MIVFFDEQYFFSIDTFFKDNFVAEMKHKGEIEQAAHS
jgi:hypothetical protein